MDSATLQTRTAMANLAVDNLKAHFAGQPLLTPVPDWTAAILASAPITIKVVAAVLVNASRPVSEISRKTTPMMSSATTKCTICGW